MSTELEGGCLLSVAGSGRFNLVQVGTPLFPRRRFRWAGSIAVMAPGKTLVTPPHAIPGGNFSRSTTTGSAGDYFLRLYRAIFSGTVPLFAVTSRSFFGALLWYFEAISLLPGKQRMEASGLPEPIVNVFHWFSRYGVQ